MPAEGGDEGSVQALRSCQSAAISDIGAKGGPAGVAFAVVYTIWYRVTVSRVANPAFTRRAKPCLVLEGVQPQAVVAWAVVL